MLCAVVQIRCDQLAVGGAEVGKVSGLAGALELGGEYGYGDGNEDGRLTTKHKILWLI